jgi:hypothetical protein
MPLRPACGARRFEDLDDEPGPTALRAHAVPNLGDLDDETPLMYASPRLSDCSTAHAAFTSPYVPESCGLLEERGPAWCRRPSDNMEDLLSSLGLSHLTASLVEEEMTLELLQSMASTSTWDDAMEELGVDATSAIRLKKALLRPAPAAITAVSSEACAESSSSTAVCTGAEQQQQQQQHSSLPVGISDLVASALSIVAATPAPATPDPADRPLVAEGFSVTHINHVDPDAPHRKPESSALAAYRRRQLQQEVQTKASSAPAQRGKPQTRYSPAPPAQPSTRPIGKFGAGGVVPVPSASARPDVFGAPASCFPATVDEHGLD